MRPVNPYRPLVVWGMGAFVCHGMLGVVQQNKYGQSQVHRFACLESGSITAIAKVWFCLNFIKKC